ncbi:DUF4179 domain-containing protein [Paenibacillus sp. 481]|uniref:DUF4179 domain-containing protein n=1 Tax=Paenibacillus sp. 481 TaxID=2835869 RepID=UPI001E631EE1|nr:DUF4179 domain-containing protein [Paenibacillus sp. 481]UHA74893.1 DUF4179 domain-containing protein [Paenibacillus sp. 481]
MDNQNELERLKKSYHEIEIPDELATVTLKGIERGKQHRNRVKGRSRWVTRVGVSAAAVLAVFTISVNTMPAFAASLEDVPGLGKLVKILQFNKGSAQGGKIQESTDINFITLNKQDNSDSIVLNFARDNKAQQEASYFDVRFTEYPNTMTFTVGGARKFSAVKDFETLKQSKYIVDAYEIVSADDTMIRFNVTFKEPVAYEVKEYKDPAQVVITLTSDPKKSGASSENQPPVYAVRTASHVYGEAQSVAEETLIDVANVRVLKDKQGTYFVEAGHFKTEAEALAHMKQIKSDYGITEPLFIEQREYLQIPEAIAEE